MFRGYLRYTIVIYLSILHYFSLYAILPEQILSQKNGVYVVKEKIDLKDDTLIFPARSELRFKGGHICNGRIIFNSTKIANQPKFRNCSYEGSIIIKRIDDRDFTSKDDMGTFRFLLKNALELGVRCDIRRDYVINMENVPYSIGVVSIQDIDSRADICFNHHTIFNTYSFLPHQRKPVMRFLNVSNVTIRDCNFHDADENNTHHFNKSTGCTFVQCLGDCESINLINCSQENGDCILRSDDDGLKYISTCGLSNSVIKVKSCNVGYGLALGGGERLTIDMEVDSPHRGFYCAGVSNSTIKYRGNNPVETKTHVLVKDAIYRNEDETGEDVLGMRGCNNLSIKAYVPVLNSGEHILCLQSYGSGMKEGFDFRFRKGKCHHQNIDFTARVKKYPNSGYYMICEIASDSGALDENDMIGCKVTGLRIHDISHIGGQATGYMCTIETHSDVDMCIENCFADKDKSYRLQIMGTSTGRIVLDNSQCGDILVRKKTRGDFYIERRGDFIGDGKLSFIDDGSIRNLVKMAH